MPDLAVYFDARRPIDAKSIADLLAGMLGGGHGDRIVARAEERHIAAVNVLKPFSYAVHQPFRRNGDWLMLEGALFEGPEGAPKEAQAGGAMPVLMDLLASRDPDRLLRLNGQFNAVLGEPSERRLTIVTDRLGSRPLYRWSGNGRHVIASEMKAVAAAAGHDGVLDALGLLELFAFGHNIGDRTVLEGVKVLPPGSIVTLDERGFRVVPYFQYRYRPMAGAPSAAEAGAMFAERVKEAVPRYMQGPARKGIFLSGGLDSRIVAGALPGGGDPMPAFTFGYPESRDVRYAASMARLLGFKHHALPYPPVYLSTVLRRVVERTECSAPFFHATSILFHDRIAGEADALLTGFCGDAFSGAHLAPGMFRASPGPELTEMLFRRALCCGEKDLAALIRPEALIALWNRLKESFQAGVASIEGQNGPDLADVWDVENRQRRFTFSAPKVDRGRFEVLAPLCDNRIVDFVLTLPPPLRHRQIAYRHAILRGFPLLRSVPWAATGQPLEVHPLKCLVRDAMCLVSKASGFALRKAGFKAGLGWQYRDLGEEMRQDGDLFDAHLDPLIEAGFFPEDLFSLEGIRTLAEDHRAGRRNAPHLLGTLLTVGVFSDLCAGWRRTGRVEA